MEIRDRLPIHNIWPGELFFKYGHLLEPVEKTFRRNYIL